MPDRDDLLREMTYNDADGVGRRAFYTMTQGEHADWKHVALGLSALIETLHEHGAISDDDLDEILLKAAGL